MYKVQCTNPQNHYFGFQVHQGLYIQFLDFFFSMTSNVVFQFFKHINKIKLGTTEGLKPSTPNIIARGVLSTLIKLRSSGSKLLNTVLIRCHPLSHTLIIRCNKISKVFQKF